MEPATIIALAAGSASAGAACGGAVVAYRKSKPEAEGLAVGTLREVLEELRAELLRKEEELVQQRAELTEAWRKLGVAEKHLAGLEAQMSDEPPAHLA